MSRVVITGGAGKLGRATVRELAAHGWDVVVFDRTAPTGISADLPDVVFIPMDFTDYGSVLDAMLGVERRYDQVDALVHLAAIPAPSAVGDHATFANNMNATYNVITAGRRAGVKNMVWGSSETVLGLPFDTPPPYVPVDENYPPRPTTTYSLVKTLEERMAAELCAWDPLLKMIGLRFSNVMEPHDYHGKFLGFQSDPAARRRNLWSYVDARDAAQAIRLALEYEVTGMDLFIIANAETIHDRSSAGLMAEYFPDVEIVKELGEFESLQSIEKARSLLGYEPRHSWRSELQADREQ